ncbi:hypothetical protein [Fontivita pretiosa]|uniref:hypothetical protein n=1 Tax=Fontivita pretiosa TaxID=2989684 RepID=UPI003D186F3C
MIRLTCTNCKSLLEIDDAFAGGVCRCRNCGTIQTVPSRLKRLDPATAVPAKASRTLYASPPRSDAVPSSGLDELAQVVASSSGLSGSHLRRPPPGRGISREARYMLLGGMSVAAAMLLGVLVTIWLMAGRQNAGAVQPPINGDSPAQRPAARAGAADPAGGANASFCGVRLDDAQTVVYLIDRGQATSQHFDYLKQAVLRSAESLGRRRRFQIVFWSEDDSADSVLSFPPTPNYANAQTLELVRGKLESVWAQGRTQVMPALSRALECSPQVIILATGKGFQFDQSLTQTMLEARHRSGSQARIHAFSIGESDPSAAMVELARQTGGQALRITAGELKRFSSGREE